jgi:hypothetical protein
MPIARRGVFVLIAFVTGAYYLWCARANGQQFLWHYDLGGYYNYLARGFLRGHLYVDLEPSPKLLALPDPYADTVDASIKMHDMALYGGHYYLYHGAAPAVLIFVPWRRLTGHDMPENFASAMFCLVGFLFSAGTLQRLLHLTKANVSAAVFGALLIALGVCQGVPHLLNRTWVYEIAIGGGYCCISAAVFCLAHSVQSARRPWWLAASGIAFGLAIGCRPHLGLAGTIAGGALAIQFQRARRPAAILPFLVTFAAVGAALAIYNYQRFGNPFEFGVHYLLGNSALNRTELAPRYVLPGLYYLLFCPPDFSRVFPWVRLAFRYPFHVSGYFLEPTAGSIFLAPFLAGVVFVPLARGARMMLGIVLASAAAIMLFVAGTGFTSQRYEVDFLPLTMIAATAGFGVAITRWTGKPRALLTAALFLLVAAGVLTNVALGITGPYDDLLKNRPASYVRLARWFTPFEGFRPLLNPFVDVEFTAVFVPHEEGFREPVLSLGGQTYGDVLVVEHHPEELRLISKSSSSVETREIENGGPQPRRFHITYHPASHKLSVSIDGQVILEHSIPWLITAPAQLAVGANQIDHEISVARFTGRTENVHTAIRAGPRP